MRRGGKILFGAILLGILFALLAYYFVTSEKQENKNEDQHIQAQKNPYINNPLSIEFQRNKKYPGSAIKTEQTLAPGTNYQQYIASYNSDGLKIYGLLAIPNGPVPKDGYRLLFLIMDTFHLRNTGQPSGMLPTLPAWRMKDMWFSSPTTEAMGIRRENRKARISHLHTQPMS